MEKDEGLAEDIKRTKGLLDKLVGGTLDIDNYFMIRNATVIQEMFGPSFFSNVKVHSFAKAKMVDDMTTIVAKSSRNRYVCCNWGLLDSLLDLIPLCDNEILFDKVLKLISTLGTHNISVANVKQCLKTLQLSPNFTPPFDMYHAKLMATFDSMTNAHGPNEFFDLDGDNSGIKISPIEKWPNSYSVSMWVSVGSFEHPGNDKNKNQFYEPRLFCFLSARGDGVEGYFLRDSLIIRTNGSHKVQLKKHKFVPNKWYHICIVHTYQWWVLGQSTLQIYVNGLLLEQAPLKYPNTNNAFTICYLGTSVSVDTAFMYIPKDCSLLASIGPAMLFSSALSSQLVEDLYKAGPNALIVPYHKENAFYQSFPKLLFAFSPKAYQGGLLQDLGHSVEHEVYMTGQTMGTTFVQNTLKWNHSLFCAGGIQLLLPLFHQYSTIEKGQVGYKLGPLMLLLAHTLEASKSHQHEWRNIKGFDVMSYLLHSIADPSSVLTNECIGALDTLITSVSKNEKLTRDVMHRVVSDIGIWRRAPFDVQMLLFTYLHARIAKSPAYFKEFFGIREVLDVLREHYSFSDDASTHDHTRKLRYELLKIIKTYIKSIKHELAADFKAIVGYLQDCTQPYAIDDVLHLLLSLAVKYGKQYISYIEQAGGYATFLNLMGKDMEDVRILSIKMIGCLLKDGSNKTRAKFMQFYGTQYIVEILKHYSFNEATYRALTEVLVGKISSDPTPSQGLLEMLGTTGNFANPQFMETILVLTSMTDIDMMQRILSDISVCLRHNPTVCESVISLSSWQEFTFTLLYAAISGKAEDIFDPSPKMEDASLPSPSAVSAASAISASISSFPPVSAASSLASALASALTTGHLIPPPASAASPSASISSSSSATIASSSSSIASSSSIGSPSVISSSTTFSPATNISSSLYASTTIATSSTAGNVDITLSTTLVNTENSNNNNNEENTTADKDNNNTRNTESPLIEHVAPASPGSPLLGQSMSLAPGTTATPNPIPHPALKHSLSLQKLNLLHSSGVAHRPPPVSLHNTSAQVTTVIELILDITHVLLHQCVLKKDGWKVVEEVLSMVYACMIYFDDIVVLERKILYAVLDGLLEELKRSDSTKPTALMRNAVNIACLVDDFIYNSENLLAHRGADGHWEDFPLVMKFLQVFDITLKHQQHQQQQPTQYQSTSNLISASPLRMGNRPRLNSSHSFPQPGVPSPLLVDSLSSPVSLASPSIATPSPRNPNPFAQLPKSPLPTALNEYPPIEMYKGKSFANLLYRIVLLVFQEFLDLYIKGENEKLRGTPKQSEKETFESDIWALPAVPELDQLIEKNISRVRVMLSIGIFGIGSKDHREEVKRVLALIQHLVKAINRARKLGVPNMEGTILLLCDILRVSARQIDQVCSVEEDWRIVESPPAFAESVGATEFMEYFDKGLLLNFAFLNKMKAAATEFERDERPSPTQVAGRRQKSLDSTRLALLKRRDSMRVKVHKFRTEVYGTVQKQSLVENTHKASRARLFYFHKNDIEKRWKKINQNVTISNLLAPAATTKQEKIFWRLSSYESSKRMRKIMAAHLYGTDHAEHSLMYESSIMETSTIEDEVKHEVYDSESNDDWIFLDQSANKENLNQSSPVLHPHSSDTTLHHIHLHPETAQEITCGRLCVTKQVLFFTPDFEVASAAAEGLSLTPKIKSWLLSTITSARSRKYLLLDTAVELFFENALSRFFIFEEIESQKQVMKFILTTVPSAAYNGQDALKVATMKWKKREITNFEYLMQLNTIAGRTYNDLNQYPVFPWVIMDYTSNKLDLSDFTIYRDLSKPVGALNDTRLFLFLERWQQCPSEIPPFHYGTHYSNAGAVLFYLMRIEPFTELFVMLQGGKFDIADRMFTSLSDCLRNCLTSTSDVKELIPEFYYFPEFLENGNQIDFGMKQNGEPVADVTLPPWASTTQEFVDISRKALESEFVSQNIHHWIDLIFGYKQRGKPAEEAANVFYHLTYAGSVDVNTLADPILREATRVQLNNFGVTPTQLFKEPHPRRDHTPEKVNTVFTKFSALRSSGEQLINFQSSAAMFYSGDRVVVFGAFGEITSKKFINGNILDLPTGTASFTSTLRLQVGKPYVMFPNNPKLVIATGKWDNLLMLINGDRVTSTVPLWCHKKPISVLALTEDGDMLVSGSLDGTIAVYGVKNEELSPLPLHILRGHDNKITCMSVSFDLDVCISGSTDKTVMIHSLRKGTLLHTIHHPENKAIHQIALSTNTGKFVIYSYERYPYKTFSFNICTAPQDSDEEYNNLYLYSPNGTLLHKAHNPFYVSTMLVSPDGEYFILAGENYLSLRSFTTLTFQHKVEISRNWVIASFVVSPDAKHLWLVAENVEMDKCCVFVFSIDKPMLEPISDNNTYSINYHTYEPPSSATLRKTFMM